MVEMTMGKPDVSQLKIKMLESACQAVNVSAGIDQCGSPGLGVPEQRTVLLKGRHRDDPDLQTCR
jgi:hypothetical protein